MNVSRIEKWIFSSGGVMYQILGQGASSRQNESNWDESVVQLSGVKRTKWQINAPDVHVNRIRVLVQVLRFYEIKKWVGKYLQ